MLTKGDDYPIHQLPEPVATAGSDRNFYDRYFFNGYAQDFGLFFSAALGVYPHLNVMDASFNVSDGTTQHNLRASKLLKSERLDTQVGPIRVEVVEPLKVLRLLIDSKELGITADLTFTHRAPAIEEPRFTHRNGPRLFMDYTRLTQNGTWQGWIHIAGKRQDITPANFWGTRDRSWGIRPVGLPDSQPVAPPAALPQFYWLWAPLNFPDGLSLYHNNANADGSSWNQAGVLCGLGDDAIPDQIKNCRSEIEFKSGTRHAKSATIFLSGKDGETHIQLTPRWHYYMSGLGYTHPEWGHGRWRGLLDVAYDTYDVDSLDPAVPVNLHIQALVEADMTRPDGQKVKGQGVLEQLVIGPYAPAGFTGVLDMAP